MSFSEFENSEFFQTFWHTFTMGFFWHFYTHFRKFLRMGQIPDIFSLPKKNLEYFKKSDIFTYHWRQRATNLLWKGQISLPCHQVGRRIQRQQFHHHHLCQFFRIKHKDRPRIWRIHLGSTRFLWSCHNWSCPNNVSKT